MKRYSVILIFFCSACTTDAQVVPTDTAGASSPALEDTGSSEEPAVYFQPTRIAFDFIGGWDEYRDELITWSYNGSAYDPELRIVLTDRDLDDVAGLDGLNPEAYCELVAAMELVPTTLSVEPSDPADTDIILRGSYAGTIAVNGFDGNACEALDPAIWQDGSAMVAFEGMRIGIAFGELTTFQSDGVHYRVLQWYEDALLGVFFAFNQVDEDGALKFVAQDRNAAIAWRLDANAEAVLGPDAYPVPHDVRNPHLYTWLSGHTVTTTDIETLAVGRLGELVE